MTKLQYLKKIIEAENQRDRLADLLSIERRNNETLKNTLEHVLDLINEALEAAADTE